MKGPITNDFLEKPTLVKIASAGKIYKFFH